MSPRDYSPLAQSLVARACALARKDHIEIDAEEALAELEKQIIERAGTYDARKGASLETWVLTGFKYSLQKAYGSPGGRPIYSFDGRVVIDDEEMPADYLELEALAAATARHDDLADEIKRPLPADKAAQLAALPTDLRRVARALIEHDFDREAAADAIGVGERQIRRACNQILELMQAGPLPQQPALF